MAKLASTVLLVHGAWCGDWVYWKLAPALERRDISWIGANLPSCRATDNSVGPLDDVDYVRSLIQRIAGPVVVVGKSYGGIVISGASAGLANVSHLVYLAAMMPEAREPFQQTTGPARSPEFSAGIQRLPDGRVALDADVGARCAFSQASEEDRQVWRRRTSAMAIGHDSSVSLDRVGWKDIPSTYIVCSEDRAILPSAEREIGQPEQQNVLERPWDHSPGVSHPEEVADLLAGIAMAG